MFTPRQEVQSTPTLTGERRGLAALAARARHERIRDAAWDALSLLALGEATREQREQLTRQATAAIVEIERINRQAGLVPPAPPSFGARAC